MALAAAQAIDAIAARITGLTLAGGRVYTSRAWPLAEAGLPAWRVVAGAEQIDEDTIHIDPVETHTLQVELRGYARAVTDLDDALNALAAEALTALFDTTPPADALTTLQAAGKVALRATGINRAMVEEGQAVMGMVTVSIDVTFRARPSDPSTLI